MIFAAIFAFVLQGVDLGAQRPEALSPKPTLTPMFMASSPGRGPAFLIACANTTGQTQSSGSDLWPLKRSALRLDGQVLIDEGGTIGPGLTMEVRSGEVWRGIIELWQTPQTVSRAVAFGAMVRSPFLVPLGAGRHTLAVRCGQQWSDDATFFVEQ